MKIEYGKPGFRPVDISLYDRKELDAVIKALDLGLQMWTDVDELDVDYDTQCFNHARHLLETLQGMKSGTYTGT